MLLNDLRWNHYLGNEWNLARIKSQLSCGSVLHSVVYLALLFYPRINIILNFVILLYISLPLLHYLPPQFMLLSFNPHLYKILRRGWDRNSFLYFFSYLNLTSRIFRISVSPPADSVSFRSVSSFFLILSTSSSILYLFCLGCAGTVRHYTSSVGTQDERNGWRGGTSLQVEGMGVAKESWRSATQ